MIMNAIIVDFFLSTADKTGRGACVLEHNCHELARCKHNKCYCLDGYDGNGDVCVGKIKLTRVEDFPSLITQSST